MGDHDHGGGGDSEMDMSGMAVSEYSIVHR